MLQPDLYVKRMNITNQSILRLGLKKGEEILTLELKN